MQSFKYGAWLKIDSVGVENINTNSEKVDIIMYNSEFYTHKQIEKKDNLVFMRIKKRAIKHSQK